MKKNLRDIAYEAIKKKITFLKLKPGDKILDSEIAQELEISRTPVREALLILERDKLVECNKNSGYIVRRLTRKEADEYFEMRELLENYSAKLIIEGTNEKIIKELRSKIEESEQFADNRDLFNTIRCNAEIHEILYRATNSEVFIETISRLLDKFQWIRAISLNASNGFQEAIDDHRSILSALENKDINKLKEVIRMHLDHARKRYSSMRDIFF